jgi:N-acetylglucosamine-6-sulfatase
MNQTSRRSLLSGGLGAVIAGAAPAAPRARRPNIIVNVMDDQRFDCLGCYEGRTALDFIRTPNMDRLAAEGVRFRNAFVTFSLCSPSRATMLSGKDVRTHGVNRLALDLQPDCAIFPALLKQAGYQTGYVGKWHLGNASDVPDPAFDHWAGVRGQGEYVDPVMNINGSVTKMPGYATEVFMDQALEFAMKKRDKPFFLWMGQKAPHAPCTPPKHLERLYEDIHVSKPPTYSENHDDKPDWFVQQHDHDFFHVLLHPNAAYQKYVKNYCRSIVSVDEELGRLMKTLDEKGLTENTVIIHIADNGHFLGEHQLYSKMLMYEESIRVPLIVRYPGFAPAGSKCDDMVLNLDMAPTVLELAGLPVPRDMEGRSFRDLVAGRTPPNWRRSYRYEYYCSSWGLPDFDGIRTADGWKYCRFPDWEQMYNVGEDPTEVRNLAQDPRHATKKRELQRELRRLGGGVRQLRPPCAYKRRSEEKHTPHRPDFLDL